jgi:cell division protein FtsB
MADQSSSNQPSSQEHRWEGQVQRAKRLREQIEGLKSGRSAPPGHTESLREQIEERARHAGQLEETQES